ncbi:hypothetical protein PG996_009144 [Apiospora saccharicola]|uniref:C2H2-type domain-containing protein n=1 Tax=Apiospora saccharicola TaxID=335842 RepID=A0ABR1UJZ4_9PEZI
MASAENSSEPHFLLPVVNTHSSDGDEAAIRNIEVHTLLQGAIDEFKAELSPFEVNQFSETSSETLKRTLLTIQRDQEQRKKLRGLSRVQSFVDKIGKFDAFCTQANIWGGDSSLLSAWIWGPACYVIKVGMVFPLLPDETRLTVSLLSGWKKIFASRWNDYRNELRATTLSLETQEEFLGILCTAWKEQQIGSATPRADEHVERSAYDQEYTQSPVDGILILNRIDQCFTEFTTKVQGLMNDKGRESSEDREASSLQIEVWNDIRKELNDHIIRSRDNRNALDQLINMFKRLRDTLVEQFEHWKAERKDCQKQRVLKWILQPGISISQAGHHERICREQTPGTGSWIFDNKSICGWMYEDVSACCLIWLNGKMGAGKTFLASQIIRLCKEQIPEFVTNYHYCRGDDKQQSNCLAVFKSILWQMASHNEELLPFCDSKRTDGGQETLDEMKIVKQLLESFCEFDLHQFVIIDGLDECESADREAIVSFWESMVEKSALYKPGKLRVLLISQDLADIRNLLRLSITAEVVELDPADTNLDIERYLGEVAPKVQAKFGLSEAQKHDFQELVCKRAKGMFLYASLTAKSLLQQPTRAYLEGELAKAIPESLSDAYVKIIRRLKDTLGGNRWTITRSILGWLAGARRPLHWHELQVALTIQLDDQGVANIDYDRDVLRADIRDMCGSLVHVVEDGDDIRLVFTHSSTRMHIRSQLKHEGLDGNDIDCDLTCKCLSYLTMDCFRPNLDEDERQAFARNGYYALQDYAVSEWGNHMQQLISHALPLFEGRSDEADDYTRKLSAVLELFLGFYPEITAGQVISDTTDAESEMLQLPDFSSPRSRTASVGVSAASSQQHLTPRNGNGSVGLHRSSLSPFDVPIPQFPVATALRSPNPSGDPGDFCEPFRDIADLHRPILQLWTHVYKHQRHIDSKQREKPSLAQLSQVLDHTRKSIQSMALDEDPMQGHLSIHTMYGRALYKCDRVLCEYFFEGFDTAEELKDHLNRHERPHHCSVSDCAIAPFGFAHKKDLTRHLRTYHPETEDGLELLATGSGMAIAPEDAEDRYRFRCTFGGCDRKFTRQAVRMQYVRENLYPGK